MLKAKVVKWIILVSRDGRPGLLLDPFKNGSENREILCGRTTGEGYESSLKQALRLIFDFDQRECIRK